MKKFMTARHFVLPILAFLAFSALSCKKSNNGGSGGPGNSGYYIKCKIDGTARTFAGYTLAQMTDNSPGATGYTASMIALKDGNQGGNNTFSLVVASKSPFVVNGVYTQAYLPGSYTTGASMVYMDEVGSLFTTFDETLTPGVKVNVRITGLSAQAIKGTFSGTLYKADLSFGHTVEEGEFNIKR